MAKKKSFIGKLIAFTTTVAAIGGVCYVFRDKIKESQAFKTASDKAGDLYGTIKGKMNRDEEDFFFDDDDDFFEDDMDINDNSSREYTSIPTIDISVPTAYENEGLSDTSEDPDVLEEQDKLDS
ncbi:MAG: hypothetical protein K6G76_05740 [Lachnospiraceae bacterium]|nr:hypothetical protein [Lachnospiraceae bacterium]